MPLDRYNEKRDFERTPEPSGQQPPTGGAPDSSARMFVVQKHAASRLHYDFRLELDGVLLSWAVPKGPSLDTRQRRLAVHVEDHPIDYGSFEGTIPQGEYGGGTVMVWDRGTYEPKEDMADGLASGSLKFTLYGDKLQGGFTLVRMKPRGNEKAENWLLIKERDEFVRPHEEYDVTVARPESAATGRDLDQITAGEAPGAPRDVVIPQPPRAPNRGVLLADGPADVAVQLARLETHAPDGEEWIHEVKYDGYRIRAALQGGRVQLLTRAGKDWTDRFGPIARALRELPVESALLDGEAVALDSNGMPDFSAMQQALSDSAPERLYYMVFDLLALDGWDLRQTPLLERKQLLRSLLETAETPGPLRYAEHVQGGGPAFHVAACDLALEGSVSKRGDRPYAAGRSDEWRKVKCLKRQEFVIGGYTEPGGSRHGFGALLLGVYREGANALTFVGRVGTGFSDATLTHLAALLEKRAAKAPPFETPPAIRGKKLHWVRPDLVAEVKFQEWTPEGLLRHASFVGLREDKPAVDVMLESEDLLGDGVTAPATTAPRRTSARPRASDATVAGVTISHPDKLLFGRDDPAQALTKLDLARYYERVADQALVHLRERPLTLVRCPHGHSAKCFFQKHPDAKGFPEAIRTVTITERDGHTAEYVYVDNAAGLVSLVQLGALEIHTWNSHVSDPEHPDQMVFDLDPGPGVEWRQIADSARTVRAAVGALGFRGFLKGTGGKGLHVVVPIRPEHEYDTVRALTRAVVDRIVESDPSSFTAKMAKPERSGRIFLDYLRNAHGATAIAPFSTRSRPGAPISLPLGWDALDGSRPPTASPLDHTVALRLQTDDPWNDFESARAKIDPAVLDALEVPAPHPR